MARRKEQAGKLNVTLSNSQIAQGFFVIQCRLVPRGPLAGARLLWTFGVGPAAPFLLGAWFREEGLADAAA